MRDSPAPRRALDALLAFLALPGLVGYAVPLGLAGSGAGARLVHPWALVAVVAGSTALILCARDFWVRGRGTLAPWAPPERLVRSGLYRHTRNPMYLAVTVLLGGWAAAFASWALLLYALAVLIAFHARVVLHEEPFLKARHGAAWNEYAAEVPRWLFPRPSRPKA